MEGKLTRTGIHHYFSIYNQIPFPKPMIGVGVGCPKLLLHAHSDFPTLYCQQGLTAQVLIITRSLCSPAAAYPRRHVGWTSCWCPVFLRPQLGFFRQRARGRRPASAAFKAPKERAKRGLRTRPPVCSLASHPLLGSPLRSAFSDTCYMPLDDDAREGRKKRPWRVQRDRHP